MDIEQLAKKMREEAIAGETYWTRKVEEMKQLREKVEAEERERAEQELEADRKLHFNAGRYAGGARDKTAIEAWKKLSALP